MVSIRHEPYLPFDVHMRKRNVVRGEFKRRNVDYEKERVKKKWKSKRRANFSQQRILEQEP